MRLSLMLLAAGAFAVCPLAAQSMGPTGGGGGGGMSSSSQKPPALNTTRVKYYPHSQCRRTRIG